MRVARATNRVVPALAVMVAIVAACGGNATA